MSKQLLNIIISYYQDAIIDDKLILAELYNNYSKVYRMESDIPMTLEIVQHAECIIDSIDSDTSENFYFQKMVIKKMVDMHYTHLGSNERALNKMKEAIEVSKSFLNHKNTKLPI